MTIESTLFDTIKGPSISSALYIINDILDQYTLNSIN